MRWRYDVFGESAVATTRCYLPFDSPELLQRGLSGRGNNWDHRRDTPPTSTPVSVEGLHQKTPDADAVRAIGPTGLIFIFGMRCAGRTACSSSSPTRRLARTLMCARSEILRASLIRQVKARPAGVCATQVPSSRLPIYAVRRTRPAALGTVDMTSMRPTSMALGRETLAATALDLNPSTPPDPLVELVPEPLAGLVPEPLAGLCNEPEVETVPAFGGDGSSGAGSAG